MLSMRGKVVLITGASSGIGRATALSFATLGARLILCARRLELLAELLPKLLQTGAEEVQTIGLDVRHRAQVESAFTGLEQRWAAVDILINNAGLSRGLAKLWEDDPQNWEEMIDTNVKGLLYVTRAIVPGMVSRGSGHIVNIGSTAGHQTYANGAVYCATKAAEAVLTEGLNIDLVATPLRVTSIDPGMVETNFSNVRFRGDSERAAKVYANLTPLQPEDVADAIVWAVTRPPHVNVQTVLLTSVDQANSNVINRRA